MALDAVGGHEDHYFAHRTFQWNNEARGKAAVHCVIIGFAVSDISTKVACLNTKTSKAIRKPIKAQATSIPIWWMRLMCFLKTEAHPICNVQK